MTSWAIVLSIRIGLVQVTAAWRKSQTLLYYCVIKHKDVIDVCQLPFALKKKEQEPGTLLR